MSFTLVSRLGFLLLLFLPLRSQSRETPWSVFQDGTIGAIRCTGIALCSSLDFGDLRLIFLGVLAVGALRTRLIAANSQRPREETLSSGLTPRPFDPRAAVPASAVSLPLTGMLVAFVPLTQSLV